MSSSFVARCLPIGLIAALATADGCAHRPPPPPLPPLPAEIVVTELPASVLHDVRRDTAGVTHVSLNATNADVRALILGIAQRAGLNVVVSPDVTGRLSISLHDVAATDAIRAVMEAAHLSFATTPAGPPFGPVVFFQPPVNIDSANARVLQQRFGISAEAAALIIRDRLKPPQP